MAGMMDKLEVENFKSYKGKVIIGPFKRFTAVIGPNGSGKSNLMDAICFVLGEKTTSLRVKKTSDLIHGAPQGKPVGSRCHVTMFYKHADGREQTFTRTVKASTSATTEYRIDGAVVTKEHYSQEMESINIFVRAKNFLVFQGAIEQVAMKNPKERTAMVEAISGSAELKDRYDKCKADMLKAEEDTQFNYQKKRGIAQDKRDARLEKEEAERYQKLKDELAEKQQQSALFELYQNEQRLEALRVETEAKSEQIDGLRGRKEKADEVVSARQREQKQLLRDLRKLDEQLMERERERNTQQPVFIQMKEKVRHQTVKLAGMRKALQAAERVAEQHEATVAELQARVDQRQAVRDDLNARLTQESQSLELNLSDEQVREYYKLQTEAGKRCFAVQAQLDDMDQQQKTDSENLKQQLRLQAQHENTVKAKAAEMERQEKRIADLADTIEAQSSVIDDEKRNIGQLEQQVQRSKERLEAVTLEIDEVTKQLADAHVDSHETQRALKKAEMVESLKRLYPGTVYGQLVDLCQPNHRRYQLAITKVLGKNMTAIVCDNETTARNCIQYLKEQRHEPETFLPVNYLSLEPVDESLRELREPRGVKLVIDVIQPTHAHVKKALQFACGNALVCETADDARMVAFRHPSGRRHKAVSLDGTLFQKSGKFSGGASDMKQKARRWDEKVVTQLSVKKKALVEESRELHRSRRKENEVQTRRNALTMLETRLKFTQSDSEKTQNETLKKLNDEMEIIVAEGSVIEPRISEIENRISERSENLKALQQEKDTITDGVFADFCRRVNIENIRVYEQRELRFHNEKLDKLKQFDTEIDRLRNELEFLHSDDKRVSVRVNEETVAKLEVELKQLDEKRQFEANKLSEMDARSSELLGRKSALKTQTEARDADSADAKKAQQQLAREFGQLEKQLLALTTAMEQRQSERHALLLHCKMQDVHLPLAEGSLLHIGEADEDSQSPESGAVSRHVSQEMYNREARIRVDFDVLDAELKELDDDDECKRTAEKLHKEIQEMTASLGKIAAPNLRASERLEGVRRQEEKNAKEFTDARVKARQARTAFEKIRKERSGLFNERFQAIAESIDNIYKSLSRNMSAQALLSADNADEPYLEGITYNCVAPGKRFRPMDNMSGGEKTVAALALLFAIHTTHPSPFFVLDEIDAALDNTNISKVAAFIREQSETQMQVIVISLKEEFYNRADALIGIYPEPALVTASGVLTLDLTKYKDPQAEAERQQQQQA